MNANERSRERLPEWTARKSSPTLGSTLRAKYIAYTYSRFESSLPDVIDNIKFPPSLNGLHRVEIKEDYVRQIFLSDPRQTFDSVL